MCQDKRKTIPVERFHALAEEMIVPKAAQGLPHSTHGNGDIP